MALISQVINGKKCYGFDDRFFEIQGKKYEIVGSQSTGRGAHDVIHTIKDEEGKYYEIPMEKLLKRLL
jgi:hypothetical protein